MTALSITRASPPGRRGRRRATAFVADHLIDNQDHSMLTAMMAVANMQGADRDIWSVNTDIEYHEEQGLETPRVAAMPVAARRAPVPG